VAWIAGTSAMRRACGMDSAAVTKGYACPLWLTDKQVLELGGHVRKGEAGELVVYANSITRTETDAKGEETEREIPHMKGYTVFNAAQCDGLPAHYTAKAEPPGHTTVLTDTFEKRPRTKNRGRP
jgi:antirestriction protein ArdC